ncbi:MAG TPA: hypothetical protein ENK43_07610 [Planctomycetes bacterium]|nr:hypothetical protein [Planctomycetota bacterium]
MSGNDSEFSTYVVRLNGRAWGIALGMLFGLGLFVATIVLVIKGGEHVGQHLSLLRVYFPFYSVTWGGAFIGFAYAFLVGYALGRLICIFYNLAAKGSSPS